MGLGCAALTASSTFPTYPNPLSETQNGAGLSSPATAIAILGKGGAGLMLLLLFMAVTSSTSAELIAVSSLLTFDIYKTYFKPNATSNQLVRMSHAGIIIYAVVLAAFCCILNAVNINLTWILTVLGIIVGGASIPVGAVLLWNKMSTVATVASPWIGLCCGLIGWFVTTSKRSGSISVTSTGDVTNAVAGNICSWGTGAVMAVTLSYIFPAKYTSTDPAHVARSNKINGIAPSPESEPQRIHSVDIESREKSPGRNSSDNRASGDIMSSEAPTTTVPTGNELVDFLEAKQMEPMDPVAAKTGQRIATIANLVYFFVAIILVPFTLFGTNYIFSKRFFTGWIVVSFIWVWVSMCICVVYPIVESRGALWVILTGALGDIGAIVGKKKPKQGQKEESV
jgi:urea-proton symporter